MMDTYQVSTTGYHAWLAGPMVVVWLAVLILFLTAGWKIFEKAGESGWKIFIPFYSTYTLFRIAGRNGWWFLGMGVPVLSLVVAVMLALDLAKHFGKSTVFAIFGLILFPYVGALMLAFGEAQYVGAKHR